MLVWMVMEPFAPKDRPDTKKPVFTQDATGQPVPTSDATALGDYELRWAQWEGMFILLLGASVGLSVGGLEGFTRGGKRHTMIGAGLGLVFGGIGSSLGHGVGAGLAGMFPPGTLGNANTPLALAIPARVLATLPIGLCLGAAIGGSTLSAKRTMQGLVGGAIGGAIGGALFDIIGTIIGKSAITVSGQTEVGGPSRAIYSLLVGALIGLFIGLVELLSRSAWLRLSLGRNEGREWSIDGAQTFIGRSEGAQVPLFGDPNIAPIHASIVRQGSQYILQDGGSPVGTYVNGQRVQTAVLGAGSQIQIGSVTLQFLMKDKKAPYRGPEAYAGQSYPIGAQPMQPMQPVQPTPVAPQPTQQAPGSLWGAAAGQAPVVPTSQPPMNQTVAYQNNQMPTQAYAVSPVAGLCIVAMDGPLMGQRFPVTGPIDLGRESQMVPMSYDSNASRRHAQVSPGQGVVNVQDLGSTNGTFVNGQKVPAAQARPGDLIKVGSTTFRVEP